MSIVFSKCVRSPSATKKNSEVGVRVSLFVLRGLSVTGPSLKHSDDSCTWNSLGLENITRRSFRRVESESSLYVRNNMTCHWVGQERRFPSVIETEGFDNLDTCRNCSVRSYFFDRYNGEYSPHLYTVWVPFNRGC